MKRSIVKLDEKKETKKVNRWNKIAESAAKQSKRDIIPKVHESINMNDFKRIITTENYTDILLFYEKEKHLSLKKYFENTEYNKKRNIAIIIGPEGGITEEEKEEILNLGGKSISLGRRILRTETAPIVVVSILQYILDI